MLANQPYLLAFYHTVDENKYCNKSYFDCNDRHVLDVFQSLVLSMLKNRNSKNNDRKF